VNGGNMVQAMKLTFQKTEKREREKKRRNQKKLHGKISTFIWNSE
jgi:hypothetical protein